MITGYTFDRAKVTASQDSALYDFLNFGENTVMSGMGNDMAVTVNGLTCTIAPGKAVVCGRLIEVSSAQNVQIPANNTGYLCLTIDLSQTNTSSGTPGQTDYTVVINQVRSEFVTSLTQNDLFNGGLIYNFPLGQVTSTSTTATFTKMSYSYTDRMNTFEPFPTATDVSPSYTFEYRCANWYRIGPLVFINFHMKFNVTNPGSGYALIGGLPFISADGLNGQGLAVREVYKLSGSLNAPAGFVFDNSNLIYPRENNGASAFRWSNDTWWMGFSGFYLINPNQ